jgi:hypothetical protein
LQGKLAERETGQDFVDLAIAGLLPCRAGCGFTCRLSARPHSQSSPFRDRERLQGERQISGSVLGLWHGEHCGALRTGFILPTKRLL